jgi:iron complex outermembrane recepter protein
MKNGTRRCAGFSNRKPAPDRHGPLAAARRRSFALIATWLICGAALAGEVAGSETSPEPTPTPVPSSAAKQPAEAQLPLAGQTEVIVSAPRMEVPLAENPAATTVVGKQTLETMPRTVAADEALKLVPGVKVDNQADGERVHLSIRGQGILTERGIRGVKVLLDGIPLNDPTGFVPDLFDVDWATVNRIEVLRGPASALYGGGGSGGIINISTDDGATLPPTGELGLTIGSYGFWKALGQVGGSTDGFDYRFSASRTWGDGYRVHTAFHATNLYGKLGILDNPRSQITAVVAGTSFFNENAEGLNIDQVHEDPQQANPDALTYNEFQRTKRASTGVVGRFELTESQQLTAVGYYRYTQWKESVPSSVQHRDYETPGGTLQYDWSARIGDLVNHLTLGTDFEWQDITDYRRPNLGGAEEGAVILSDQDIEQSGLGLWALDRLELSPTWSVVAGVREDSIDNTLDDNLQAGGIDLSGSASFDHTSARVGVAWEATSSLAAYASWGQGFLPPATEELANNPEHLGGFNEELKPATSNGGEIGVRGTLGPHFGYDVGVFRLETKDDFGRYRMPSRPLETFYNNAGDSTRYGLETLLSWIPIPKLACNLAYTYSHFTYDQVEFSNQVYYGTWLPNSPRHQAYLDVAYDLAPRLQVGGNIEMYTRAYIDPSNTTWIGGYTLYGARLSYGFRVFGDEAQLLVSGRNLTGKEYIAFTEPDPDGNSYQPGPTLELFAGVLLHL